jgi:hypothetical protein
MTSPSSSKEASKKSWPVWVGLAALVIVVGIIVLTMDPCMAVPQAQPPAP